MNKLLNLVVDKLRNSGYVNDDNYEIVRYGFELVVMKTIICVAMLIIGLITKSLIELLAFMLAYQPLRSYCGGYHAKSRVACIISSLLMLSMVIFLSKIISNSYIILISLILILVSSMIIFLLSPIDTPTKPFDDIEKSVFGKRSRIILIIVLLVAIAVYILNLHNILFSITLAVSCASTLLIIGKIQNSLR